MMHFSQFDWQDNKIEAKTRKFELSHPAKKLVNTFMIY